jgi:branched-chain amino acid transport system substrate-binding protein
VIAHQIDTLNEGEDSVKKFLLGISAVSLLSLTLAGCGGAVGQGISNGGNGNGGSSSVPGVDPKTKTITIGASTAVTGPQSFYYQENQGAMAYFNMLNANGGIDGWKIDYKLLDDAYQPSKNLANVQKLVEQEHVFAIVVNQGTPTNVEAAHYLANTSTPVVGPTEGVLKLAAYPNYFALMPNYGWEAGLVTQYAHDKLGATKVGILYENDDLGIPANVGATATLKALGLTPVASVPFSVNTTDFSPYISELASKGAQTVVMWGSNGNVAAALKAANRISFNPKWFTPFWIADPSTIKLAGSQMNGVYSVSWFLPTTAPASQDFVTEMQKSYPKAIGSLAENGWSEASLFGYALKQLLDSGKPVTQQNFMDTLNSMKNADIGTVKSVTFTKDKHTVGVDKEILIQNQGGKFVQATDLLSFPQAALDANYAK